MYLVRTSLVMGPGDGQLWLLSVCCSGNGSLQGIYQWWLVSARCPGYGSL
jgi:hypothetical protein